MRVDSLIAGMRSNLKEFQKLQISTFLLFIRVLEEYYPVFNRPIATGHLAAWRIITNVAFMRMVQNKRSRVVSMCGFCIWSLSTGRHGVCKAGHREAGKSEWINQRQRKTLCRTKSKGMLGRSRKRSIWKDGIVEDLDVRRTFKREKQSWPKKEVLQQEVHKGQWCRINQDPNQHRVKNMVRNTKLLRTVLWIWILLDRRTCGLIG